MRGCSPRPIVYELRSYKQSVCSSHTVKGPSIDPCKTVFPWHGWDTLLHIEWRITIQDGLRPGFDADEWEGVWGGHQRLAKNWMRWKSLQLIGLSYLWRILRNATIQRSYWGVFLNKLPYQNMFFRRAPIFLRKREYELQISWCWRQWMEDTIYHCTAEICLNADWKWFVHEGEHVPFYFTIHTWLDSLSPCDD